MRVKYGGKGVFLFTTLSMTNYWKHLCFLPCNFDICKLSSPGSKTPFGCNTLFIVLLGATVRVHTEL